LFGCPDVIGLKGKIPLLFGDEDIAQFQPLVVEKPPDGRNIRKGGDLGGVANVGPAEKLLLEGNMGSQAKMVFKEKEKEEEEKGEGQEPRGHGNPV
jgi:hypothetical protein